MNNRSIARQLRAMSELLEADGQDARLALSFRQAADAVRAFPVELSNDEQGFDRLSGVPSEIQAVIRALIRGGVEAGFEALPLARVPAALREVLELPGIGPKTARALHDRFGVRTAGDLLRVTQDDPEGLAAEFGPKNAALLRDEALRHEERKRRLPLEAARETAEALARRARAIPGVRRAVPTGETRRFCPTVQRVSCLVSVEDGRLPAVLEELRAMGFEAGAEGPSPAVDPVDGRTVAVRADGRETAGTRTAPMSVYLAAESDFALAWIVTTSDERHREALRRPAVREREPDGAGPDSGESPDLGAGPHLGESPDGAGPDRGGEERADPEEARAYARLGWPYVPPELREGPDLFRFSGRLLTAGMIRGDLHMHSQYSDGSNTVEEMVRACSARGYAFMAMTDHSQSLRVANGLSVERLRAKEGEIARLRSRYPEIEILHGAEVDILPSAELDYPDEVLAGLDIVVASVHVAMHQSEAEMTARVLRAIESGRVRILGHPTGRLLSRRHPFPLDFPRVFAAAARHRVALEINSNPDRLDLDPVLVRSAALAGCLFAVDSDAHAVGDLGRLPAYGVPMARKGLLPPDRVVNTWTTDRLRDWLRG